MEDNNKKTFFMRIWVWFSWDKLFATLFLTIFGWAAFMRVYSGVIGAYIIIFGFCMGLIWLLRRQRVQAYFIKISNSIHAKMPLIISSFIVIIFIFGIRFSPIWQKVVDYAQLNNPYQQLVRTASASVQISVKSDEAINTTFMGSGGYLAFGKGTEALLLAVAPDTLGRQTGGGVVIYSGVFNMDASSNASYQKINFLKQAEYIQIMLSPIPEKSSVLGGKAIVTINNSTRFEFTVQPQQMSSNFIFIRDVQKYLQDIMR